MFHASQYEKKKKKKKLLSARPCTSLSTPPCVSAHARTMWAPDFPPSNADQVLCKQNQRNVIKQRQSAWLRQRERDLNRGNGDGEEEGGGVDGDGACRPDAAAAAAGRGWGDAEVWREAGASPSASAAAAGRRRAVGGAEDGGECVDADADGSRGKHVVGTEEGEGSHQLLFGSDGRGGGGGGGGSGGRAEAFEVVGSDAMAWLTPAERAWLAAEERTRVGGGGGGQAVGEKLASSLAGERGGGVRFPIPIPNTNSNDRGNHRPAAAPRRAPLPPSSPPPLLGVVDAAEEAEMEAFLAGLDALNLPPSP
jgi:hypothetical protein